MATIIHRRPAPARGAEPARGPGASLDALTPLGYASAVAAFGFLVFGLRPLADLGGTQLWNWGGVAEIVFNTLRNAAIVGLPAALEWGVPGARRVTPWLMRGTVLLALEQLAQPLLSAAQEFVSTQLEPNSQPFAYDTPLSLALGILRLSLNLLAIGGAWALADGLFDAGSRPRRGIVGGVVIAGMAVSAYAYLPLYGLWPGAQTPWPIDTPVFWMNLVGIAMGFLEIALWYVVGTRLVAGLAFRLRPRLGWGLGAVAGAASLAVRFAVPLMTLGQVQDPLAGQAVYVLATGLWIVLWVAFAAGLGRAREHHAGRVRLTRLYVRNPVS